MSLSPPSGYSASQRTPAFVVGVTFGASGRSSGAAPMRIVVLAPKTSAGTAPLEAPTFVPGTDDARTLTGPGSRAFLALKAAFDEFPGASVDVVPVAEATGVAATAVLTFTGPATAAGTARVTINGEVVDVGANTGDTAAVIAAAARDAINAKTDWPVTATATAGATTIVQKNKGTRGNDMMLHAQLLDGLAGVTVMLNGGTTVTGNPTTAGPGLKVDGKFGTGTGSGSNAVAGTGTDDLTNALASIATVRYDHHAPDQSDTTNWQRLVTHLNTYSGIGERRRQRAVVATTKDLASAITDGAAENAVRLQVAWHYNAENTSGQIAAQVAAARIYGDGSVGGGVGRSKGEQAYRAANLDGTLLASIRQQADTNDRPLGTEIELALQNGLAPLAPAAATPGFCRIVRSITNRAKDAQGNPTASTLDTAKVEVMDYAADRLEAFLPNEFPNKNLVADTADNRLPANENVVTPSMIRAAVWGEMFAMQDEALLVNVAGNPPEVEISDENPSLALIYIPTAVINGLHNVAIDMAQIG